MLLIDIKNSKLYNIKYSKNHKMIFYICMKKLVTQINNKIYDNVNLPTK